MKLDKDKAMFLRYRLNERYAERNAKGCWLHGSDAYPIEPATIVIEGKQRIAAHRASLLADGFDVPDGWPVRHSCGVTGCINPDHLTIESPLPTGDWIQGTGPLRWALPLPDPGHLFQRMAFPASVPQTVLAETDMSSDLVKMAFPASK